MAHTFTCLFLHVIFSTKNRASTISADLAGRLHPYIAGIVQECKGNPLIVNGTPDHVHMLLSMPSGMSLAEMMRLVKANSSRWVHETFPGKNRFEWQVGYGAFTVSGSRLEDVRKYIAGQQEHHKRVSFQEEFRVFLARHGVEVQRGVYVGLTASLPPLPGLFRDFT
jgi:REP element-mobilizing transposase RayT